MAKLKAFIGFCTLLCYFLTVNCQCEIPFPSSYRNIPSYRKFFGSLTISIPYEDKSVSLLEGEKVYAYCATNFSDFDMPFTERFDPGRGYYPLYESENTRFDDWNNFTFACINKNLIYTYKGIQHTLQEEELTCKNLQWDIYESATRFDWCEPTVGFYILVAEYPGDQLKLGAACFDVTKKQLRTLHYSTGQKSLVTDHNYLQTSNSSYLKTATLAQKIDNFNTIFNHLSKSTLETELSSKSSKHNRFNLGKYELKPIVQGGLFVDFFQEYEPMLDIIWWSNLRCGNWKRFMDALDKRSAHVTYNIFAGTSGAMQIPSYAKDICTHHDILKLRLGNMNTTVPAYIWTYLRSENEDEEFVVVGYNSPFFDFFAANQTILCEDICGNISWLNDVRSTFRYSILGVTFCCSVDAVRSGNLLDGFPVGVTSVETTKIEISTMFTDASKYEAAETASNEIQKDNEEDEED